MEDKEQFRNNIRSVIKSEGEAEREETNKVEFSEDEESLMARMYRLVGPRWKLIAGRIPGRTAEEIEKYFTDYQKAASSSIREYSKDAN